jgi:pilus assembly protein CpaC
VINKSAIVNFKKPVERVSVAKPAIADTIVISPTQLQINGIALGSTTLIVWEKGEKPSFFDLNVIPDINEIEERIKAIAPKDDVKVAYANDHILLSGTVANEQMINKILAAASAYAKEGTGIKTTRFSAGLTETVETPAFRVLNYITLKEAQQVLLEVRVASIDKGKLKELGLSSFIEGTFFGGDNQHGFISFPSSTVIDDGINARFRNFDVDNLKPQIGITHFPSGASVFLRALETKDLAKILAEPNLIVRSGERGNFHAGRKVPVQVVTGTPPTPSIEYRDVGIRLNFAPEVLDNGVIRLKIDPAEVSNIVRFLTTAQGLIAPEIDARTVNTSVDLRDGESLILAGLLSEEMKKNIQKIPLLGDIPILGALFRNTTDEIDKKELAFFITPRLVKPMAPGVKSELPGEKPLTPKEENEYQWIPLPKKGEGK